MHFVSFVAFEKAEKRSTTEIEKAKRVSSYCSDWQGIDIENLKRASYGLLRGQERGS